MRRCERFANILEKPAKLYHSKDDTYGKGMKIMIFVFAVVAVFFFILQSIEFNVTAGNTSDLILVTLLKYMTWESVFLCIFSFISHKYIYGRYIKSSLPRVLVIVLYYALWFLAIISLMPVFAIMKIINKIASYRAKKIDNLQCVWLIFTLDLYVVYTFCLVEMKTHIFEKLYDLLNTHIKLNSVETQLFLFLGIVEAVIIFINYLICEIIYKDNIKKAKERNDIVEIQGEPKETLLFDIPTENNTEEDEIEYDKKYQKKTLIKMHILTLVLVGFAAVFLDYDVVKEVSSELLNVVTVFTLIILYLDKREELAKISY